MNFRSAMCSITASLLLALAAHSVAASEFFVAPDGNDTAVGSLNAPFATIQRAQKAAAPGDTVYLRGGTYKFQENQIARKAGIWAYVTDLDKSGTKSAPINYFAYQNERPIFDLSAVKPANERVIAFFVSGSWLHFKGFEVTGVQVTIKTHTQSESFENRGGNNNVYEQLAMHDSMAIGFYLVGGANNLILNCDAYRNYDYFSEDGRGGNTDGFGCHPARGGVGNVFRGCRSWFNSDDGYDCIHSYEAITFENCWAMYNGFSTEFKSLGDGNGFKAGGWAHTPLDRLPNPIPSHTVRFCLAVRNKASGFYANHHLIGNTWINNTAYENGNNYDLLMRGPDNEIDVPGFGQIMINNLGFKGYHEVVQLNEEKSKLTTNYFTLKIPITATDFESLDEKQLVQPRQPNGNLPKITFMHLADGSPLIDKGTDADFPFKGAHPDLGAFER